MSARLAIVDDEWAMMSPTRRAGLTLFLGYHAPLDLPDGGRSEWAALPASSQEWWIDLAAQAAQAYSPHPQHLRWCVWPGCPMSYDVISPDPGRPRWIRPGHEPMCPSHAALGHLPGYGTALGDGTAWRATCSCGATAVIAPASGRAMTDWWAGHVMELPVSRGELEGTR
ncbi:hypothetical protein I0C86_41630 [Plantactinospora sp. S1510]|uniref:Uncharacterized protein n=1 Tax=Plantactinospora alkalitolerans TaxID=2789879 RepID=A0ABS0HA63_9ACTN|nr:hypothetical protein [Plantactinospora alkalitolerans]MBF9135355.1 hypothetical protein [Plantactinospora alkalitolerans]